MVQSLCISLPCCCLSLSPHSSICCCSNVFIRVLNRRSRVFLKLDNLQPSGSFKSRGIGNFIICRAAEHRAKTTSTVRPNDHADGDSASIHFYAASGGNAGIACVHAARLLGHRATVVIPRTAKPAMVAKLWAMGATKVIQHGSSIAEAQEYIHSTLLPIDQEGVFVPPFDHPDIWDGNATLMREIVDQLEGQVPDVVACSVGGGGLLNGVMQVVDEIHSRSENQHGNHGEELHVLAMETKGADSLNQSLLAGKLVTLPRITSQAMSLGVVRVSQRTFDYAQRPNVTSVVLSDAEAARGCYLLAEHERMLVELTVGVNVPLCYGGMLQRILASKNKALNSESIVVIVVCGGNDISVDMLMAWRKTMMVEDMAMGMHVEGQDGMIDEVPRVVTGTMEVAA